MATPHSPRTSVEQALDRQRLRLRLTWREVARRAGVSPETLRKIRLQGATGVNPVNVAAVEQALALPQGAIRAIQEEDCPVQAGQPAPVTPDEVSLVDAPGGGRAWRLTRMIGGEELRLTISARSWITRAVAVRELTRLADQMEAAFLLQRLR